MHTFRHSKKCIIWIKCYTRKVRPEFLEQPTSIDSNMTEVKKNADGSVDIYFGPKAPEGMESNWLPTDPKRRFFLLGRFYGPEPGLFEGSFEMNNIELVK